MTEQARRDIRIVVLGDGLVSAAGDPKGMGWVGRVTAKTPSTTPRIDIFTLPAPDETTSMLAERWTDEVKRRFSADTENRLVIALSNADPAAGISISRSRLNIATIVDEAKRAKFMATIPLGRFSTSLDVANAALYLASDEGSFISGVCIEVDGARCV